MGTDQGRAEGGTTPTTVGGPGPKGGPRQGQIMNKKKQKKLIKSIKRKKVFIDKLRRWKFIFFNYKGLPLFVSIFFFCDRL